MVKYVDSIQPEFKLSAFVDLEPLDHVHVQAKASGSLDRAVSESPNFSWLRIYQNDLAVRSHDRFVAVARVQAVQRCDVRQARVRDLRESIEEDDAVGNFLYFTYILRQ